MLNNLALFIIFTLFTLFTLFIVFYFILLYSTSYKIIKLI